MLTALVLLFKVQIIDNVTVPLFTWRMTLPLSLLLIGVYVLGMFTGSSHIGLLRVPLRGVRLQKQGRIDAQPCFRPGGTVDQHLPASGCCAAARPADWPGACRRGFLVGFLNGPWLCRPGARLDLTLVQVLAEPPEGWTGESGQVDRALLERRLPANRREVEYFLCGPKLMTDAVQQALSALGVPLAQVHFELVDMV